MELSQLESDMLLAAYEAKYVRERFNFVEWGKEKGIERDALHDAFDVLAEAGLLGQGTMGGGCELTGIGVIETERAGLADDKRVRENDAIRSRIAEFVVETASKRRRHQGAEDAEIREALDDVEDTKFEFPLAVLYDTGQLVRDRYRGLLPTEGLIEAVADYRKRRELEKQLRAYSPSVPGSARALWDGVAGYSGWAPVRDDAGGADLRIQRSALPSRCAGPRRAPQTTGIRPVPQSTGSEPSTAWSYTVALGPRPSGYRGGPIVCSPAADRAPGRE